MDDPPFERGKAISCVEFHSRVNKNATKPIFTIVGRRTSIYSANEVERRFFFLRRKKSVRPKRKHSKIGLRHNERTNCNKLRFAVVVVVVPLPELLVDHLDPTRQKYTTPTGIFLSMPNANVHKYFQVRFCAHYTNKFKQTSMIIIVGKPGDERLP